MDSRNKTARTAGLLYLVTIVSGIFSLIYVPSHINVHGDAASTVQNIIASEFLFRLGIAAGALGYVAFLLLPLALYELLGNVNRHVAILMVAFGIACVPMEFVALEHRLDILSLLTGENHLQIFTSDQQNTRVMSLLDAYDNAIFISEIFWGLWLLPFGYLVFKCNFLPKVLGVLLMLGCFSYLIGYFGKMLFPHIAIPRFIMSPASFGEIGICLWLLIAGARKRVWGNG
ncbi:MAG: DUF4386 domain-containing protein [Rudaea sp.]|nr:DUF4386 domain-containing protein [Rudaea sp.]